MSIRDPGKVRADSPHLKWLSMRRLCSLLFAVLVAMPTIAACQAQADTMVVVVRHAEKATDDPRDPGLSAAGAARAQALANALRHLALDAVLVSQFRRTQLTAAPAAAEAGIQPIEMAASAATVADAEAIAARILRDFPGGTVLVVGHSNTVPAIVAALSGHPPVDMADDEYDRFTLVSVGANGGRRVVVSRY